jgi:hypothetical protein
MASEEESQDAAKATVIKESIDTEHQMRKDIANVTGQVQL